MEIDTSSFNNDRAIWISKNEINLKKHTKELCGSSQEGETDLPQIKQILQGTAAPFLVALGPPSFIKAQTNSSDIPTS